MRPRWPNPSEDPGVFLASWKCPNRGVESREPGRSTLAHKEGLIGRRFDGKDTPPQRLFHAGWRAVSGLLVGMALWIEGLTQSEKLALVVLCDRAGDDGLQAYPGMEEKTEKLGISARSVMRVEARLAQLELIQRVKKGRVGQRAEWRIRVDNLRKRVSPRSPSHAGNDPPRVTPGAIEGDTTVTPVRQEPPTSSDVPNGTSARRNSKPADPRIAPVVAAYVTAHGECFGARPNDIAKLGDLARQALADGWDLEAIESAAASAGEDSFGAAALMKHLRNAKAGSSSFDRDWQEVEQAVARGRGAASLSSPRARAAWKEAFGPVDGRFVDLNKRAFAQAWHAIGVTQRRGSA